MNGYYDVNELLAELRRWRLRAENAEAELSDLKAQWFGNFDRELDSAEPVQLKFRCPRCWREALARVADGGSLTIEATYERLVRDEWCVEQEQQASQRSLDGWLAANPRGKKW